MSSRATILVEAIRQKLITNGMTEDYARMKALCGKKRLKERRGDLDYSPSGCAGLISRECIPDVEREEDEGGGAERCINADVPAVLGDDLLELSNVGLSRYMHVKYVGVPGTSQQEGWKTFWRFPSPFPVKKITLIRMFGSDVEAARAHRDLTLSMAEEPTNGDPEAMWNYITRLNTKESENALSPEERAGEFKCEVCTRVFNSARGLHSHGRVHLKKKKNIRGSKTFASSCYQHAGRCKRRR